ncbi:MAG TPA: DUF4405 domain-containing protein [Verrucomicrobiota bacterium]|nr:DUF4405 domain-containing protein [Verrucomicrobiota bacterium]
MKTPNAMAAAEAVHTDTHRATHAFRWRALISVVVALAFLLMVVSGIGLWVSPPGRIANWTDWTIFGLGKHEWADLHICFAIVFVIASGFHLALNWRPLLGYFKSKLTRHLGFRREWIAALIVCGVVFAGTRREIPPFSTFLEFTKRVQGSWEQKSARPPIPHAELLTLSELAQQADVSLTNALALLAESGIKDATPEMRVAELARHNQISAQRVYEAITAEGKGEQRIGPGGGFGRLTLAAFCQEEGIDLQTAQSRLKANGIEASASLTIREIAAKKGYQRPREVLEVIRGD